MILTKQSIPSTLVPEPVRRVFEEGPLVVEYAVTQRTPSHWIAYGVVIRGVPPASRRNPHPEFVGEGPTEHDAVRALVRELENFLDEPYWNELPCH
jgi:hypothetical protein